MNKSRTITPMVMTSPQAQMLDSHTMQCISGCVVVNTRPHQLCWDDRECGHYMSCMYVRTRQMAGFIHAYMHCIVQLHIERHTYICYIHTYTYVLPFILYIVIYCVCMHALYKVCWSLPCND